MNIWLYFCLIIVKMSRLNTTGTASSSRLKSHSYVIYLHPLNFVTMVAVLFTVFGVISQIAYDSVFVS